EPRCCDKYRQARRGTQVMAFPCQVLQRRMAIFAAQPFGPGLFLCDAAYSSLIWMTKLRSLCLASRKNRLRRGRDRNVNRPYARLGFFVLRGCCKTPAVERAPISKQDLPVPNKVRPLWAETGGRELAPDDRFGNSTNPVEFRICK